MLAGAAGINASSSKQTSTTQDRLCSPGERLALESSLTMDAVPGVERLRVVLCREPKALADVRAGVPEGCEEQRIDVPKSAP